MSILNTVIFDIEAPRNEKWLIMGITTRYRRIFDIECISSISDCLNIEDSSIFAFKTYTNIEALCFEIEGALVLILAGPACAGLQQLQAAV